MNDITRIDKNFMVESTFEKEDARYYSAEEEPFRVYGVFKENGRFRRLPEAVADIIGGGVHSLHADTAGGRVRFMTDSPYVAVHAEMDVLRRMNHFPLSGSCGFDMYVDGRYLKTFVPPYGDIDNGYESGYDFEDSRMREICINFPLYATVKELYIKLQKDAKIEAAPLYEDKKPIVFYGSSITQGGCDSRPGMSYESILSRRLNRDFINLGFSGAARAEIPMADHIKNLDMSLFVYDYDYNAPNPEELIERHERMFLIIREANPTLPILMLSKPKYVLEGYDKWRRDIVETTYKNAKTRGDENVYFLDGPALMALCGEDGTVDNVHPTDFGFASMAMAIEKVIRDNNL